MCDVKQESQVKRKLVLIYVLTPPSIIWFVRHTGENKNRNNLKKGGVVWRERNLRYFEDTIGARKCIGGA